MFVSISFIVLMMISLAWLVFYYIQRFRYLHAKDRLSVYISYLQSWLILDIFILTECLSIGLFVLYTARID